jgi:hypothetical protein
MAEEAGVEPTKSRLAALPGFEVRTPHRGRFSSSCQSVGKSPHDPAVGRQYARLQARSRRLGDPSSTLKGVDQRRRVVQCDKKLAGRFAECLG